METYLWKINKEKLNKTNLALYSDFVKVLMKAEYLFISKIYSAGEKPLKGINSLKLVKDIKEKKLIHLIL